MSESGSGRKKTSGPVRTTGLAASVGRFGVATGKLVVRPARAAARAPLVGPLLRGSAQGLASEAERAVDSVLAGPLPEEVARSLVEHRVLERVGAELLASPEFEAAVVSALENERTEQLVERVLASPAVERLLVDVLESRLTLELTDRMMRSAEFERVLKHVLSSPEVRAALGQQTAGLADEVAVAVRRRATHLDDAAERGPRRWVRRQPRVVPEGRPVPYAGLGTRGLAFVIDVALAHVIFLVGGAVIGLVASIVGKLRPEWLVVTLASAAWLLVVVAYFVVFWTTAGQTPGMRLLRLRVLDGSGAPPGLGRSLVRLVGLALAIVPLFAGFLPVLVDDRRRALQDFLARTVVVYDEQDGRPAAGPQGA